jgi:hypothetical protein
MWQNWFYSVCNQRLSRLGSNEEIHTILNELL